MWKASREKLQHALEAQRKGSTSQEARCFHPTAPHAVCLKKEWVFCLSAYSQDPVEENYFTSPRRPLSFCS